MGPESPQSAAPDGLSVSTGPDGTTRDRGPRRTIGSGLRAVGAFLAGTFVWLALFLGFLLAYSPSAAYGLPQALAAAVAWCLSTLAGALVSALLADVRQGDEGSLYGLAFGFIVAGGGLVYTVLGFRPAGSDAWPTDLLIWVVAVGLAMVSGLSGGWIGARMLSRRR